MKTISTMRTILVMTLTVALTASCGTAKKTTAVKGEAVKAVSEAPAVQEAADYSGNYEWVVKGTPNGDQAGSMTLKKTASGYSGQMGAMGVNVPIENIVINDNKMSGYLAIQDMELGFTITFAGEAFSGSIFTAEYDFPFTGKKVK